MGELVLVLRSDKTEMLKITLIVFLVIQIQRSISVESLRNPRIFFPLTTSTSTVTATEANLWTVCFVSSTTLGVCSGRKRRRAIQDFPEDLNIDPQPVERDTIAELDNED